MSMRREMSVAGSLGDDLTSLRSVSEVSVSSIKVLVSIECTLGLYHISKIATILKHLLLDLLL